ncbi:MAG: AbrB/MazE/SpoVT family DNA-binding domain-containing protein [Acidimicrobiales bacterium]
MEPVTAKVTKNGQISLPAEIRRRWGVREVLVVDKGDHAEVRPWPEDPLDALTGKYAHLAGPTSDEMRRRAREEEAAIEERKLRRYYGGKTPRR